MQMYEHIRQEMARGHGIYIVCPFVEASDKQVRGSRRLPPAACRLPVARAARQPLAAYRVCAAVLLASVLVPCTCCHPSQQATLPSPSSAPLHPPPLPPAPAARPCPHRPAPRPLTPLACVRQEEVKAATEERRRLVEEGVFADADCGLLHGQMAPEEKEAALQQFKQGHTNVLVRWGVGVRGMALLVSCMRRDMATLPAAWQAGWLAWETSRM